MEVELNSIITSLLDGSKVLASPPPLYPFRKSPKYPLNRRLDGTLELLWMFWRRQNLLAPSRK
jgi:hypothetical protein